MYGVGPAFCTELIFFLGKGNGLIMDQWTSRSVNLLFNRKIVALSRGKIKKNKDYYYAVKKSNDRNAYEKHIQAISELSKRLSFKLKCDIDPSKTEEYIFSLTTDRKKQN